MDGADEGGRDETGVGAAMGGGGGARTGPWDAPVGRGGGSRRGEVAEPSRERADGRMGRETGGGGTDGAGVGLIGLGGGVVRGSRGGGRQGEMDTPGGLVLPVAGSVVPPPFPLNGELGASLAGLFGGRCGDISVNETS